MNNDELIKFFQEGIVNDLIFALRHYFIWRTIGEHSQEIEKSSDKNRRSLFYQLQSSSQDLAVLNLAKIFDKSYNGYKVRSIEGLLSLQFEKTNYFPLETETYEGFLLLQSLLNLEKIPLTFNEPKELVEFLGGIFFNQSIQQKVKNLKYVRNKYIAHNEHEVKNQGLEYFWEDFMILTDFLKIFISLFGLTILGTHYFQFEFSKKEPIHYSIIQELYWLVDEIEKVVGKENLKYWWNI